MANWKQKKLIKTKLKRVYNNDEDEEDYSDVDLEYEYDKKESTLTSSEEKMINLFKKTYDAKHIKTLTDEKKDILKRQLNPVLNQLMNNLTVRQPPHQFIEGPNLFAKLTIGHKNLYLFGDSGFDYSERLKFSGVPYLTIFDYINYLQRNTDSFFDFYLENNSKYFTLNHNFFFFFICFYREIHNTLKTNERASEFEFTYQNLYLSANGRDFIDNTGMLSTLLKYLNEQKIQDPSGINSTLFFLERLFKTCFDFTTRNDISCQLSRMCILDITNLENTLDPFYLAYIVYHYDNDPLYSFKLTIEEKIALYKNSGLSCLLRNLFFNNDYNQSIFSYIINNIKDTYHQSYYQSEIKRYIMSKIEILTKNFLPRESILNLIHFLENDTRIMNSEILKIIHKLEFFCYNIQDMKKILYSLSRIFKLYYVKEGYQPIESNNIILYIKQNLFAFYVEFLISIGGQLLFSSENTQDSFVQFPNGI